MAKTIHKYVLMFEDEQNINTYEGAELLSVKMQHGRVCVWALVDQDKPQIQRRIQMHGTGHNADHVGKFIDTVIFSDGELVFHLFDGGERGKA